MKTMQKVTKANEYDLLFLLPLPTHIVLKKKND